MVYGSKHGKYWFSLIFYRHFTAMVSTEVKLWFLIFLEIFLTLSIGYSSKVALYFEKMHQVFQNMTQRCCTPLSVKVYQGPLLENFPFWPSYIFMLITWIHFYLKASHLLALGHKWLEESVPPIHQVFDRIKGTIHAAMWVNYRLIPAYLLSRVNLYIIMHTLWDFDALSARTRRVSALDNHQNWCASALFCLNFSSTK